MAYTDTDTARSIINSNGQGLERPLHLIVMIPPIIGTWIIAILELEAFKTQVLYRFTFTATYCLQAFLGIYLKILEISLRIDF